MSAILRYSRLDEAGIAPVISARGRVLDLRTPLVMGILNVTPDSFSDGGKHMDPALAEEHALRMERDGASIIDVGAESTRPGAVPVDPGEELERLLPVLKRIIPKLGIPVSVDTYKPEVMQAALDLGVSVVNDVTGLRDARSAGILAKSGAAVILMHMRGNPQSMQSDTSYADLMNEIGRSLRSSVRTALDAGIAQESIVLDPGVGFGKSFEDNFDILHGLNALKHKLSLPVMAGVSRKGFLRKIAGDDPATLRAANAACHMLALKNGADILRVHDVTDACAVIKVFAASGADV